jgi:hypothetical protein
MVAVGSDFGSPDAATGGAAASTRASRSAGASSARLSDLEGIT